MIDVFYLTYGDDFSQANLNRIRDKLAPGQQAYVVKDVPGIYNAHRECALSSNTDHFYVIDGDAYLVDEFDLSYVPSDTIDVYPGVPQSRCVHVWRAYNPVIDMTYGYGGVKLLHKELFQEENPEGIVDMSTTIAKHDMPYWAVPDLSCISKFNTTPFNTWKAAFREVAKLVSGNLSHGVDDKIKRWMNPTPSAMHSSFALLGATKGKYFGEQGKDLSLLNDFEWLKQEFENHNYV